MTLAAVAAVVPTLDERTAIGELITGLRSAGACCVFVVDGGSRDGTPEVAGAAGAHVIHEGRRGYGRACLTGAEAALDPDAGHAHDAVAFLDGDGSCDPADLGVLMDALATADVVLGRRPRRLVEGTALPWHAWLGNRLVAALLRLRTGRTLRDLPPFKVVRALTLKDLRLDDERYGWTVQLVGRALADPGIRITERDVAFRLRRGGQSKVSGSVRASVAAARGMIGAAIRSTAPRPVVALVAKAPRAGHSKTRLAAGIGVESALSLWSACLTDTGASVLATARRLRATPLVVVAEPADAAPVGALLGPSWPVLVQHGTGLAGGIVDACLAGWDRGATRVVVIAGDSPTLPPRLVERALGVLAVPGSVPGAVLGPTLDGGYYLIGVSWHRPWMSGLAGRARRRFAQRIGSALARAALGSGNALESTRAELVAVGLPTQLLDPWLDVDTVDDLAALRASLSVTPAPRTRLALEALDRG